MRFELQVGQPESRYDLTNSYLYNLKAAGSQIAAVTPTGSEAIVHLVKAIPLRILRAMAFLLGARLLVVRSRLAMIQIWFQALAVMLETTILP